MKLIITTLFVLWGVVTLLQLRAALKRFRARAPYRAERRAMRLLARRGYEVVDEQVPARFPLCVDGQTIWVSNRCDCIVRRRGRTYVVEVKSGVHGVDPLGTATRRQLLEYWLCHEVDGVLLVDMRAHEIRTVSFPKVWAAQRQGRLDQFS